MKRTTKKGDAGEAIISTLINEIKDEQYLIDNLILLGDNDISHQFDHILIRHNGVFIIETKNYYGKINGNIDDIYWTKTFLNKGKTKVEKFMNPVKQNNAHIRYLKKILGRDIPFINFVVFVHNDVSHLGIYTVTDDTRLVKRILSMEIDKPLSRQTMKDINDKLLRLEADINVDKHVDNIEKIKKQRRDIRKESILVMEKGLCPICGNKVQMNKNIYLCNKCGYKLVV